MQPLPDKFLKQIARQYDLSSEQEEVFVSLYSGQKRQDIIESLHISDGAFRTRMTGIYQKFSIGGKGGGKQRRLHYFLLKQLWQEKNPSETSDNDEIDIAQIRGKIREDIEHRCGKMQVLDMTQSITLSKIYTEVNILEQITARNRSSIDQLIDICGLENWEKFDRLGLGRVTAERVSGLKAVEDHGKLMVWGKPGSGKTTFLKYLAIQCISEKFLENHLHNLEG